MNDIFGLDELSRGNEKLSLDWDALKESLEPWCQDVAVSRYWDARDHLQNLDKQN